MPTAVEGPAFLFLNLLNVFVEQDTKQSPKLLTLLWV